MPIAASIAWIYGRLDPNLSPSSRATKAILIGFGLTLLVGLVAALAHLAIFGNLH